MSKVIWCSKDCQNLSKDFKDKITHRCESFLWALHTCDRIILLLKAFSSNSEVPRLSETICTKMLAVNLCSCKPKVKVHQVKTKKIITMKEVWVRCHNKHRFLRFYFFSYSVVFVSIETIYHFQLSPWCLDISMKHCRTCLICYLNNLNYPHTAILALVTSYGFFFVAQQEQQPCYIRFSKMVVRSWQEIWNLFCIQCFNT